MFILESQIYALYNGFEMVEQNINDRDDGKRQTEIKEGNAKHVGLPKKTCNIISIFSITKQQKDFSFLHLLSTRPGKVH